MHANVYVLVPQKDVWILAASLPKWDTQNISSGLTSRAQSTVNYHVNVYLVLRYSMDRWSFSSSIHTYGCAWDHVCINASPPDILRPKDFTSLQSG